MNTAVAIVAHQDRALAASRLARETDADVVWWDDGTLGCERNHLRAWQWHRDNTHDQWSTVLEDDAQPVTDFTNQLHAALTAAPSPIVSLYLGTSRPAPWQRRIHTATTAATATDASWITGPQMLHAVGIAIHTQLLTDLCGWLSHTKCPIDQAIGAWAAQHQHHVAYTWPSLTDHADHDTIAKHRDGAPRTEPRKAWSTGHRDTWTTRTVPM